MALIAWSEYGGFPLQGGHIALLTAHHSLTGVRDPLYDTVVKTSFLLGAARLLCGLDLCKAFAPLVLNAYTTGNPFFLTILLEVGMGRDFAARKGLMKGWEGGDAEQKT